MSVNLKEGLQGVSHEDIHSIAIKQIKALVADETDMIANMANVAAHLFHTFHYFWVGFYIRKNNQLVLGPFQGPVACTRINLDKGVCGHAATIQQSVIVPNVHEFLMKKINNFWRRWYNYWFEEHRTFQPHDNAT